MAEMTLDQQRALALAAARMRAAEASPAKPQLPQQSGFERAAQEQGTIENTVAALGGRLKGLGYIGPRQILGMSKPGEYEEWKQSMEALTSRPSGKVGDFLGYALPVAATAPLTGASVMGAGLAAAGESFVDPADSMRERGVKTGLGFATGALGQKVGNVIGNAVTNRRAAQQLSSYPGAADVSDKTLAETINLGYRLPPSAAGKQSMLESVSGQIKTQQAMSDANQLVTDKLIRSELADAKRFGISVTPNTPLTTATLKQIRSAAAKPYEQIRSLGKIELVTGRTKEGNKIVKAFDAKQAVDDIKQLRHDGHTALTAARNTGDPEKMKQAMNQLDSARVLEDRLEAALENGGNKKLLDDLRAARQLIAKSYNIQDAVRESVGKVDARDIGALYEMGEKGLGPRLTGNLANVGKAGSAFKESMGLRGFETPKYSALDFAVGGINAANAQNPAGLLAAGIPLLRGPARSRLLSDVTQRKLLPQTMPPGFMTRNAPRVLDWTPVIPGTGTPIPVMRGMYPGLLTGGVLANTPE